VARGDGRVFQRGRRWWVSYYVRGVNYRRPGGDAEEAARDFLRKTLKEIAAGRHVTPREERVTVAELLSAYEDHLVMNEAKSLVSFRAHAKAVRIAFGRFRAVDLTTEHVERFKKRLLESEKEGERRARATVNRYVETLRAAFNLARRQRRISTIPYFPLLTLRNARKGFFEKAEVDALVALLPEPIADMTLFAYLSGWRKGEIVPLAWDQIDRGAGEIRLDDSKNGEGRVLPLEGELAKLIAKRWVARQYETLGGPALSRYVFHSRGRTVRDFRKSWATACEAARLPGRLFHDLRRSAVRDMIRAGVPQAVAMEVSGHKSTEVFRRYNIVSARDQRQALRQTEAYRAASSTGDQAGLSVPVFGDSAARPAN
jgi:integrase